MPVVVVEREEERRAKVAGTCEITDGKFQPSESGRTSRGTRA